MEKEKKNKLLIGLFIIFFYIGIYFFGIPMNPTDKPLTVSFLESKAFILLFILLFVQFFKYVLNIDEDSVFKLKNMGL